MLALLCQWLYISFVAFSWGVLVIGRIDRLTNENCARQLPALILFLVGLSLLGFLGNLYSLFFPIGPFFQILILSPVIFCWAKLVPRNIFPVPNSVNWLVLLLLFIIAVILVTAQTMNIDEAGYYLPLVKWIEHYKVVPGTANLIARTGFNSGFHMLSAIFGHSYIFKGGIYELNGLLFIWFNYYFISAAMKFSKDFTKQIISKSLLIAALIFPFSFLVDSMDSDYLVIMGGILINAQSLRDIFSKKTIRNGQIIAYFTICFLLIITKVFSIFLILGPLALLFSAKSRLRLAAIIFILCLSYLTPWFLRNVIISGYLVFPMYYLDMFELDWKVPYEMARASYLIVEEFAKLSIIRPEYTLDGVRSPPFSEWFPIWLNHTKSYLIGWVTLVGLAMSVCSFTVLTFKSIKTKHYKSIAILGLNLIVVLLWILNFPAIRFGWSWILTTCILSISFHIQAAPPYLRKLFITTLLLLVSFSWLKMIIQQSKLVTELSSQLIVPTATQTTVQHELRHIDMIKIKVASDDLCHGTKPPCLPLKNNYKIAARGKRVEAGFKVSD